MDTNDKDLENNTSGSSESCPEIAHFKELEDFVNRNRHGNLQSDDSYCLSVRASFSKCYDFNIAVRESLDDSRVAFCLPSLRGICEDIIVLGYLNKISRTDKNNLIDKLFAHGTAVRTRIQSQFFEAVRPHQPVLPASRTQEKTTDLEVEIRTIWRLNGWPNLNRGVMPPTREIAQKQGSEILLCLYDYLYRLTSGTVHFDVPSLWKTGWGESPSSFEFSVWHFNAYYASFARVYGAFLFVCYVELFADLLSPSDIELAATDEIRKWLYLFPRWPEMVTFEEMNITPPERNLLLSLAAGLMRHERKPKLLS